MIINLRNNNHLNFTLKTLQMDPDSTICWILKELLVTSPTTKTKTRQIAANIHSTFPLLAEKTVITQILAIATIKKRRKKRENAPSMYFLNLRLKVTAHSKTILITIEQRRREKQKLITKLQPLKLTLQKMPS